MDISMSEINAKDYSVNIDFCQEHVLVNLTFSISDLEHMEDVITRCRLKLLEATCHAKNALDSAKTAENRLEEHTPTTALPTQNSEDRLGKHKDESKTTSEERSQGKKLHLPRSSKVRLVNVSPQFAYCPDCEGLGEEVLLDMSSGTPRTRCPDCFSYNVTTGF